MSAYSNIDRETFNWVRSEIDVTIEAVRRELQQFVTSDDKQDLDGLVNHLQIEKGLPESPIEVVELINRIRELRGEEHVEISALFSPMIEVYPEVDSQRALNYLK